MSVVRGARCELRVASCESHCELRVASCEVQVDMRVANNFAF